MVSYDLAVQLDIAKVRLTKYNEVFLVKQCKKEVILLEYRYRAVDDKVYKKIKKHIDIVKSRTKEKETNISLSVDKVVNNEIYKLLLNGYTVVEKTTIAYELAGGIKNVNNK